MFATKMFKHTAFRQNIHQQISLNQFEKNVKNRVVSKMLSNHANTQPAATKILKMVMMKNNHSK